MAWAQWDHDSGDLILRVRVVPRAKQERLEPGAEQLRVRLNAPPVDGKANDALCRLLARRFGVNKSAVSVSHGHRSRDKTVRLSGPVSWPAELAPPPPTG